jgi:hypothetical protein
MGLALGSGRSTPKGHWGGRSHPIPTIGGGFWPLGWIGHPHGPKLLPPPMASMGWQTPMALGGGSATPNDQTHFFGPWGWPIHPPRAKGWLRPLEIGSLGWPKPPLCYTGVAGHPLYFFKFFFFFFKFSLFLF